MAKRGRACSNGCVAEMASIAPTNAHALRLHQPLPIETHK
jgi:hypothetical protein